MRLARKICLLLIVVVSASYFGALTSIVIREIASANTTVEMPMPEQTVPQQTAPQLSVSEKLRANTVVLTDIRGHGSGVLFTRGKITFIWTAAHVADNWEREDGTFRLVQVIQGDDRVEAEVLRCGDAEGGVDVALLRVVDKYFFAGDTDFYFDKVRVGQRVIHCGSPLNRKSNERLISYGCISGVGNTLEGHPLIVPKQLDHVDITAYPGCSGGPVIDAETEKIVGLVVMGSRPGLEIIEPARRIHKWAEEHGCLWACDRSIPVPKNIIPFPSDKFIRELRDEDQILECNIYDGIRNILDNILDVSILNNTPVLYSE